MYMFLLLAKLTTIKLLGLESSLNDIELANGELELIFQIA